MKKIQIKEIKIANFKGIASGTFNFDGNTDFIADVMQGKSTIKDAYLFVMGIDIDNFFPVDINNKLIEGLKTRIDLTIDVDGMTYTLAREASVKYKTDKSTNTKLFDGFKKDVFEFDGVPCNTTKFKSSLVELFNTTDFDTLKCLSVLNHFNEVLDWKARRAMIYNLYADKNAIATLKDNPKYSLISDDLKKGRSSADISTILNSENNHLVDDKRRNEILLADAKNEFNTFEILDYNAIETEISKVEEEIIAERKRIESLSVNAQKAEIEKQISELKISKTKLESNDTNSYNQLLKEQIGAKNIADMAKMMGEKVDGELAMKTRSYKQIKEQVFDDHQTICPTCGQSLPEAQIAEIKANWDNDKEKRLNGLKTEILGLKGQKETYVERYTEAKDNYDEKTKLVEAFLPNPEIKELANKIVELENSLNGIEDVKPDYTHLYSLKTKKDELYVNLGKRDAYAKLSNKIVMLEKEHNDLINKESLLLKKRAQLEEYTLDIIALVNDSINSHFNGIKFKLFETLTATASKSIKETLVVLNNGVDYGACSTGQKAETNMIIVSTLQNTLGVCLPIFVDDASITNFKTLPENQMVFLYNEKGKSLDCIRIRDLY